MAALTTVQITNNTGEMMRLQDHHEYNGSVRKDYPHEIENGETVYFVFENQEDDDSSGAVVYGGVQFDWMYAWYNRNGDEQDKYKAYTEIANVPSTWVWERVKRDLMNSGPRSREEVGGYVSEAFTSQPLYPAIHQARMSLQPGGSKT